MTLIKTIITPIQMNHHPTPKSIHANESFHLQKKYTTSTSTSTNASSTRISSSSSSSSSSSANVKDIVLIQEDSTPLVSTTNTIVSKPHGKIPSKPSEERGTSTTNSDEQTIQEENMIRKKLYSTTAQFLPYNKVLTLSSINPYLIQAEYAVRGKIVQLGLDYQEQLKDPIKRQMLPFNHVIECNIGNPQALGQKPITFPRQVLSLLNYPDLLQHPNIHSMFPKDVIERVELYRQHLPNGVGAYSGSQGHPYIRHEICEFLLRRDGYKSNINNIFLTDGASQAVQCILRCLIHTKHDAILVPIPQYPLYSASITLNGGTLVPYFLHEKTNWSLNLQDIRREINKRRFEQGENVRALVIINPGNPTGQCLDYQQIQSIIQFAKEERLMIMADEVYQENIYSLPTTNDAIISPKRKFISFKKVLCDMKEEDVELISFHSTSKGFFGECGRRGGYMELTNITDDVKEQIYKLVSINLCSNIEGQVMVGLMVNPPKYGEPSYNLFEQEKNAILDSLERRSHKLFSAFNSLPGIECNPTEGSLYLFPRIHLPQKAIQAAGEHQTAPDAFYCTELLNKTGIVVVPGSGFGQEDQTWHFRMTLLPPEDRIDEVIQKFCQFHNDFMNMYH